MENYEGLSDEELLSRAEELIAAKKLDEAQSALDAVKPKSGRKYFVQSKLFKAKGWYSEERKQLKFALKAEPDNEEYKKAMDELETFRKSDEFKTVKGQMGNKDGFWDGFGEACCLCSCEACGTGFCEAICNGCS